MHFVRQGRGQDKTLKITVELQLVSVNFSMTDSSRVTLMISFLHGLSVECSLFCALFFSLNKVLLSSYHGPGTL